MKRVRLLSQEDHGKIATAVREALNKAGFNPRFFLIAMLTSDIEPSKIVDISVDGGCYESEIEAVIDCIRDAWTRGDVVPAK